MRITFGKLLTSAVLATTLALPLTGSSAPKPPAPQAAAKRREGKGEHERHPEIRAAIRALERAKEHLERAAHDFGGHRAEALASVNKALEQLRLALQYDKD